MPKLKQPKTLEDLSIAALGKRVAQKGREAIGLGTHINISDLNDYLYAEMPRVLSDKVTTRMLSEVVGSLENEDYRKMNVVNVFSSITFAITYHDISCLDLSHLPRYAAKILSCNIQTFKKLRTLIFYDFYTPSGGIQTLPIGLRFLKLLVNFRMNSECTDVIISILGSCCSGTIEHIHVNFSVEVTDASFKILMKCHKLKYLSICDTSMTAEGYGQFMKSIQQHKKSDDTEMDLLRIGVGSGEDWEVSTTQLNEIAISFPKLKQLEICNLHGDLEALVSLTALEVLQIQVCDFHMCNFEGFLRLSGSNLISLELQYPRSVDLGCILNHCINIKRLVVDDGSIMDTALGNMKDAAKALLSLEDIHLDCGFSSRPFEHMLYACVNVKRLNLRLYLGHMIDEFILRLLSHNPLQKLSSFAVYSRDLTMKSVNAIIDHCPLLEKLEYFRDKSKVITDLEIKKLRQRIADNNQDLQIMFS